ncbi:protocatechuate 3,4-dioxygenase subunit alpha [Nocardioides lentus]|uniref:Protocatechuate 3,4-dioxygenase subunit alpha n=1 Tax=Nocardioides lentus TaxID=338077 RepID=A0ABP5ADL1_9ACTN
MRDVATDLAPTPGQTVGPFYGYALPYPGDAELVAPGRADAVRLHGVVTDGEGAPVPDALLEIWQADPAGAVVARPGSLRRDGWTFTGWGRCATLDDGSYSFTTLRPGRTSDRQAPYVALTVFARGLLDRLQTRIYLPEERPGELAADPLLAALPPERRDTLVATADDDGFRFDLRLQGEDETVFLTHGPARHDR